MATERLLMRHIREILRLKWTLRRSHRDTARSLGISAGAVASVVIGGVGSLMVAAIWMLLFPDLRRVDRYEPADQPKEET